MGFSNSSASGALDGDGQPITRPSLESIERYIRDNNVPMITVEKGQRKDDIANQRRAAFTYNEGVGFVVKAQEKCSVYRTLDREIDSLGESSLLLVPGSRLRPAASINSIRIAEAKLAA